MECAEFQREEVVERYVAGSLSPEERESFEDHYFACEQCFAAVQAQRALQAELSASAAEIRVMPAPHRRALPWKVAMAAAVAVILTVLGIRWGIKSDLSPPAPSTPPAQTAQSTPVEPSLVELARFDPPIYTPVVLRGAQDEGVPKVRTPSPAVDRGAQYEATSKFRGAMKQYQKRDYTHAITGLRTAARLNAKEPSTIFFLGVSYLLADQTDAGIEVLRHSVALGDTPYLEESHYYLAKAFLRKGDLAAARRELQQVVHLEGDHEDEARRLLEQLEALGKNSH